MFEALYVLATPVDWFVATYSIAIIRFSWDTRTR